MPVDAWDEDRIETLDDRDAFRYCSGEELRTFLDPAPDWRVADFGSGTGLFTSELAPVAETVLAVDIRQSHHAIYRAKGIPADVAPVTADFTALPFPDDHLDGAVSVRTYHHGFEAALGEVARVLKPGGRLAIVDWSDTGAGEREGRDEEYLDLATVQSHLLEHDFAIAAASERRETFVVVGKLRD
jgi:SAM-dependent methyltransferase